MPDNYKYKVSKENPGEIYSSIYIDSRDFSKPSDKLSKKRSNTYVTFCKKINEKFSGLGKNATYNEEYQKAIDFLDWDLSAEEYSATVKFVLIAGLFLISAASATNLYHCFFVIRAGRCAKTFSNTQSHRLITSRATSPYQSAR